MGAIARGGRLIGVAIVCAVALAADWLLGHNGLGLAFAAGAVVGAGLIAISRSTSPALQLSAVTAEPGEGWAEFHRELNRSRRFDRRFGVVRFVGVGAGIVTEQQVRDRVAGLARRIDRVWLESDAASVEMAVARARAAIGEALGVAITAAFPASGITSGALIAALYQGAASPVAIAAVAPVTHPTDTASSTEDAVAEAAR